ncbi:MAG: roadblock/LC7 domain-containing protein [Microthrixaceae bacterium]
MSTLSPEAANVSFLVERFATRVRGVRSAVVVSADGLLMTMSSGLERGEADRFAAVSASMIGLAHGSAAPFGFGAVREVVVELEYGLILLTGISEGAVLAVLAGADCDPGLVGFEMARLVEQCGPVFTPELRAELQGALTP